MAPRSKGVVQAVGAHFKVTYPHRERSFELGPFATEEEAKRVSDVLTIKEAVDSNEDPKQLELNFALGRYNVDSDTVGEIQSVSFTQVVQDLQVCAVRPAAVRPAPGGERLASAGRDAAAEAARPQPSASASAPAAPRMPLGLKALPPRGAPAGRARPAQNPNSAAAAAFNAAGLANASAAAAHRQAEQGGRAEPLGQSRLGAPAQPPTAAAAAAAAEAADGQAGEGLLPDAAAPPLYPHPRSPPITARKRPVGRVDYGELEGAGPRTAAQGSETAPLQLTRSSIRGVTTHGGGKWRPQLYLRVEGGQVSQGGQTSNYYVGLTSTREEAALVADLLNIWRHSCYGSDPAQGDYNYEYTGTSKVTDIFERITTCGTDLRSMRLYMEELIASGRIAALIGQPAPQIPGGGTPAAGKKRPASPPPSRERETKLISKAADALVAIQRETPALRGAADSTDAGRLKGVYFDPRIGKWRPRLLLHTDAEGRPARSGKKKQNISLPACDDQLEGAVLHDLGTIWVLTKTSQDLATARYNFDPSLYNSWADGMEVIKASDTISDFRQAALQLRDSGEAKRIATANEQIHPHVQLSRALNAASRKTASKTAKPLLSPGTRADPQNKETGPGQRSRAQIVVRYDEDDQPASDGSVARAIVLPSCDTAAEAAICWDVGSIWRELLYGNLPEHASEALNLPVQMYLDAGVVDNLRKGVDTQTQLQSLLRDMRKNGGLKRLADVVKAEPQYEKAVGDEHVSGKRARKAAAPLAGAAGESIEAREESRIRAVEDMYDKLKLLLSRCPGLSEIESVGFLARFVQLRDSRRWQFSQIMNWDSNKQYDLIREYVRQTLGIHPAPPA